MKINHKKITIVIVSHNGRHYLPDCLASVFQSDYPASLLKVMLVDNDSTDSTVGYVQENYPQVKVVENRKNLGFTQANNQGWLLAEKNKSDYLVLLNQDTIVDKNWLRFLSAVAESDKKIAMVQPKIMLYPETDKINSWGNSIHFLGFAFCNHYKERDKSTDAKLFGLPYASGAACLIKMSALKQVGLFDPRLFMYHEDVDLGWRLRLAGRKIMLAPQAVVYHKYHYSKAKYKFYYMERNRFIVMLKNYHCLTLLLLLPALVFMEVGIIFFSLKNGWFKEKIKGDFWLLFHLPVILKDRMKTQFKIRKTKDREVLKLFTGSIKFQEIDNPLLKYLANPLMEIYFFLIKKIIFW